MKVAWTAFSIGLAAKIGLCGCAAFAQSNEKSVPDPVPFGDSLPPPRQTLFEKYFPHPTGNNGMEEYLKAADIAYRSRVGDIYRWENCRSTLQSGGELSPEDLEFVANAGLGDPAKDTVLDARRKSVQKASGVLELIEKGNSKAVFSLHKQIDLVTLFPELSEFKQIAKFLTMAAYVKFADGDSAGGTRALLSALEFANRLPQDSFIFRLVTIAINAIVLAEFERNLGQLSHRDTASVLTYSDRLNTWKSRIQEALLGEQKSLMSALELLRQAPKPADHLELAPEEWDPLFESATPADWQRFVNAVQDRVASRIQTASEVFKGPEDHWFMRLKAEGWTAKHPDEPVPTSLESAAISYADTLTEVIPGLAESEARCRTILRLLFLHARVLDYRWKFGRLPEKLSDAVPAAERADPFAGGEFEYRPDPYGHYQLYSRGFGGFGRIDLKYRRDPHAVPQPLSDPPPKAPR